MVTTYTEFMDWQLDAAELRVLGALMEKEKTTPEYYPMSLNALVNACNQKSNREPVVSYDEDIVETALQGLREKGLSSRVSGGSRVPKHEHRFTDLGDGTTRLTDHVDYRLPFGVLGGLADRLVIRRLMGRAFRARQGATRGLLEGRSENKESGTDPA